MSRTKLTDQEIAARMVELRNLRKLHAHDRKQITTLKARVKVLEQEKADDRAYFEALIQKQAIQIAELQTMVFGKKKRPPMGGTPIGVDTQLDSPSASQQPRSKDSYRRPVPPASAVTKEVAVPLPVICSCGGRFNQTKTTVHERYEEDIPLPELTEDYQPRLVTKYVIERGECLACGKHASSKYLGGQAVTLGPNVRLLVCHLITVVGLSYAQTTNLLLSLYGLVVSKAELATMLRTQHSAWTASYNQLKSDIRAAPVVHADETPWPIQTNDRLGYAWLLADASSPKVCFALEQSRGAVHAKALFGKGIPAGDATMQPFAGVRISDDYAAYRSESLPGFQQLCWAHLYRTIRDLRYNANLLEEQLSYVTQWYTGFAGIYSDLRTYLKAPYDGVVREEQATELWQRVQALAHQQPNKHGEPQKLTRLKAQLLRAGPDRLFVCLQKDTPCDNNRAERDLRQLVLKRKRSFGSKSEKGAQALATVLSLCTTAWRSNPTGYFKQLALLG
jgi:transposase